MASSILKEAETGNLQQVKKIIALYPSALSVKNVKAKTALHLAAAAGHSEIVAELLSSGAAHDAVDKDAATPLHCAAEHGATAAVKELLCGAGRKLCIKSKNNVGATPLHLAVKNRHADICRCLIDAGAKMDMKDKAGLSPIDLAGGDVSLMHMLMGVMPIQQGNAVNPSSANLRSSQVFPSRSHSGGGGLHSSVDGSLMGRANSGEMTAAHEKTVSSLQPPATVIATARPKSGVYSAQGVRQVTSGPSVIPQTARGSYVPKSYTVSKGSASKASALPLAGSNTVSSASVSTAPGPKVQSLSEDIQALQTALQQSNDRIEQVAEILKAELKQANDKAQEALSSHAHSEMLLQQALSVIGSQTERVQDLETRLLIQEDKAKEGRACIDRLEKRLAAHDVATSAALESEAALNDKLRISQTQLQRAEHRLQQLEDHRELEAPRLEQHVAQLGRVGQQLHQQREAQTFMQQQLDMLSTSTPTPSSEGGLNQVLSKYVEGLAETVGNLSKQMEELNDQVKASVDLQQQQQLEVAAATEELQPGGLPIQTSASCRSASARGPSAGVDPWSSTTPRGNHGRAPGSTAAEISGGSQSFVQRLEFESSLRRVEEHAREAAAKEAAAKRWMQQVSDTEDWRGEREHREASLDKAVKVLEAELESAKLKLGRIEGQVGALEGQVQELMEAS